MTNPGDSDEWWKQYGGEGVSPESGAQGSVPQYPQQPPAYGQSTPPPSPGQYPPSGPSLYKSGESGPAHPQQSQPGYGRQPGYPQQSQPSYPQQSQPGYAQQPGYPQQPGYGQPGYPQPGYPGAGGYQPYGQPPSGGLNGMALASMIVSILGLVSCCTIILPAVGLVLGIVAMNQMKTSGDESGKGMAQAGIWVGAAGVVINLLYWILTFAGAFAGTF
ncbi:DUF4190 domain-containing protein [Nocardia shimofusensis]|uniref:DUF4190 domain-containing protein n=1 Tax=Nocardia shimofusensis TaxID=228596 RepID=UPI000836490D|nr:DUF4190 domain-containing protein [Nocardia shimofusensis]